MTRAGQVYSTEPRVAAMREGGLPRVGPGEGPSRPALFVIGQGVAHAIIGYEGAHATINRAEAPPRAALVSL
jgi:hypothetical protein